jgi:hypothetical protein
MNEVRDTMFCPECKAEYPESIFTCDRCHLPLVRCLRETAVSGSTFSPPRFWVGFVIAAVVYTAQFIAAFTYTLIGEIGVVIPFLARVGVVLTSIGGGLYWLYCVDRMHAVLLEATDGQYPITPSMAGLYHFIPIYSVYWIFKWPNEIARFVNSRLQRNRIKIALPGALLLLGILLRGPLGLVITFAVGAHLSRWVQTAIAHPVGLAVRALPEVPIEAMFRKAINLEQEGEWEKAIAVYDRIAVNLEGHQDAQYAKDRAQTLQQRIQVLAC